MTRRLIIIAKDGTPANFLVGVERDYLGLIQFFKSKEGGAYTDKEMFLFPNGCSRALLQTAIQLDITGEGIDKIIVVFCGHGFGLPSGDFAICFNNGEQLLYSEIMKMCAINDIKAAVGQRSSGLLITDCCRAIPAFESGGVIRREQLFCDSQQYSDHYIQRCKELYNQAIAKIPSGAFFVAQSCQYRQTSSGDDVIGGVYTNHLLKQAHRMITEARTNADSTASFLDTFSVSYIHMLAKKQMAVDGIVDQIPVYSGPRCSQPPFCVIPKESRLVFG